MKKNYQQISLGTLNTVLTLVRHADNAQMNFVTVGFYQAGGAAVIFSKSWNLELTFLW